MLKTQPQKGGLGGLSPRRFLEILPYKQHILVHSKKINKSIATRHIKIFDAIVCVSLSSDS